MFDNTLASFKGNCLLQNVKILDLFTENCIDEIGYVRLSLEVPDENSESGVDQLSGSEISISFCDDTPLFCGYCDQVSVNKQGDYITVDIVAYSYVRKADYVPYSVTYQDTGKTLEQVANIAFQKYGAQISSEIQIAIPFVVYQQKESDWDFVRRLANQFGKSLFTNVKARGTVFSIGACGGSYSEDSLIRLVGMSKNIDELLDVQDAWVSSTYIYKPRNEKRFYAGPVWDADSSMRLRFEDKTAQGWLRGQTSRVLLQLPEFRKAVQEIYISDVRPVLYDILLGEKEGKYLKPAEKIRQEVAPSLALNYMMWNINDNGHNFHPKESD